MREKCVSFYEDTLKSRLNNKNTPIILIMQRIHKKDLVGYLMGNEHDKWDFLQFPLIDENNKILWEEKFSIDAVNDLRTRTPRLFFSQYQQKPENDLTESPFANVEIIDYFGNRCIAWLDPSSKGRDYTAFCLVKRNFTDMMALGFMFKKSWDECVNEIAEISREYGVHKIIAETNGVGNIIVKLLSDLGANVVGYNTTLEKTKKIMALAVYRDSIKLSDSANIYKKENNAFIDNCKNWSINSKEHDDGIDAFASVMDYLGLTTTRTVRN
jgi:hypothetical protein